MKGTPKILSPEKARVRVQNLCARAEHCEGEIRKKLKIWGISSTETEKIIEELIRLRFVDDTRFARSFVKDKIIFARWGKRKIALALKAKGVDSEVINASLSQVPENEYKQTLKALLEAKMHIDNSLISSYEGRTKLYRFALQRGFETQLITVCIKELLLAQSS